MASKEVYTKLINHFREWIFGLPDGKELMSLLEMRITPDEADLLSKLPFLTHTPEQLSMKLNIPVEELEERLEALSKKGLVFRVEGSTSNRYAMVDSSWPWRMWGWKGEDNEESKKFAPLLNKYFVEHYGAEYLGYPSIGLRAVPINETVEDPRQVMPYEDILKILDKAKYFTKTACPCKHQHNQDDAYENCKNDLHVCLHFDRLGEYAVQNNFGTEITKEETLEILKKSADAGMVHGVSNSKEGVDTICNCCKCCCTYLNGLIKMEGAPRGHIPSNYIREIDEDKCIGCGTYARICPMDAIDVVEKRVHFTQEKCIGCGVCVHKCPQDALHLVHRDGEQDYPENPRELATRMLNERGHNPMESFKNNYWR
jgi:ferredoxin